MANNGEIVLANHANSPDYYYSNFAQLEPETIGRGSNFATLLYATRDNWFEALKNSFSNFSISGKDFKIEPG